VKLNDAWYCPDCDEVFWLDADIFLTCPSCTNRLTVTVRSLVEKDLYQHWQGVFPNECFGHEAYRRLGRVK